MMIYEWTLHWKGFNEEHAEESDGWLVAALMGCQMVQYIFPISVSHPGGTLNVEMIGMLVRNFFRKP